MNDKNILVFVSVLMGFGALMHLVRILAGWELVIGSWLFPSWLSALAFLIAGFLSYKIFKISKR